MPARARSRDMWLKVLKDAVDTGAIPRNLQREVCCACYLQKATGADDERKRYGKSWPLEPAERWRAQAFRACALAQSREVNCGPHVNVHCRSGTVMALARLWPPG